MTTKTAAYMNCVKNQVKAQPLVLVPVFTKHFCLHYKLTGVINCKTGLTKNPVYRIKQAV